MCSRIFPLAFLLSLSLASAAQQSGGAKPVDASTTCPVTTPEQTSVFVPPSPYSAKAPAGSFWFGSDRLWTALPANGSWKGLPHYTPNDPTFRQKLFFGREGYDWHTEPQPRLKVTGKRLDSSVRPVLSDQANNGWIQPDQPFMLTAINFPTLGCWEITARYENDELAFVIWVAK